jgi:SOS response associated peptidase (SRAP)
MCFHNKQSKNAQEIENRFKAKFENKNLFEPTNYYNGFTFPKTPIITNENISTIQMANWGLLPHWATTDFDKSNTLNARIETLNEKKSFKDITQKPMCFLTYTLFKIVSNFYNENTLKTASNVKTLIFCTLFVSLFRNILIINYAYFLYREVKNHSFSKFNKKKSTKKGLPQIEATLFLMKQSVTKLLYE